MIGLAVKLTYAGVGDYWEDVDQNTRNQGVETQFTEEDIPHLQKIAERRPAPLKDPGLTSDDVLARTVGGFSNHVPPLKVRSSGCCTPHGNMRLFYAWDVTLRYSDEVAQINLLLNRASPWMDIDSHLPYEGRVVLIRTKQHGRPSCGFPYTSRGKLWNAASETGLLRQIGWGAVPDLRALDLMYLFTNLKAAQIQPLEDFAGHMLPLGLS
jgi:hypothetical protein